MAPDSEPKPRVPWLPVTEGAQPPVAAPTPAPPELTPTKPTVPAWIRRDAVPEPVEVDEGDIVAPVTLPPAEEMLPRPLPGPAVPADSASPQVGWTADPVHRLGQSAVANAHLSASGAPTPLGGVPVVDAEHAVEAPNFGADTPLFTPRFAAVSAPAEPVAAPHAPPVPSTTGPTPPQAGADAIAAGLVAQEKSQLAAQSPAFDAVSIYSPVSFAERSPIEAQLRAAPPAAAPAAGPAVAPAPAPAPATPPAEPATASGEEPPQRKRRWWLWLVLGVVLVAAGAIAIAYLNRPEPVVEPGAVVTVSPPAATIEPIAAPTGTAFQSAMPTIVGTYSLVEATAVDPADIALTAGRVADAVDLTYRSGENTMKVRALQYFNEQEATAHFTALSGDGAATTPVEAGGQTVGESAVVVSPKPAIVWRNGTSVFVLTGPPLELTGFFEGFGL